MTHTVGGRTVKSTSRKFLGGVVRTIGEVVATSATHVTQDVLFNDLECIAVVIGESTDVFIGRRIIDEYDERILAFRDRLFYEEYRLRAGQSSCVNCFHASFSLSLERVLHACC